MSYFTWGHCWSRYPIYKWMQCWLYKGLNIFLAEKYKLYWVFFFKQRLEIYFLFLFYMYRYMFYVYKVVHAYIMLLPHPPKTNFPPLNSLKKSSNSAIITFRLNMTCGMKNALQDKKIKVDIKYLYWNKKYILFTMTLNTHCMHNARDLDFLKCTSHELLSREVHAPRLSTIALMYSCDVLYNVLTPIYTCMHLLCGCTFCFCRLFKITYLFKIPTLSKKKKILKGFISALEFLELFVEFYLQSWVRFNVF